MMRVQKRGGRGYEAVKFDKITARIETLVREGGYEATVNSALLAQHTIANLYDGISTEELDYIAASVAESRKLVHPDYSGVAGRIMISNLHKTTPRSFSQCMMELNERLGNMSRTHLEFIIANAPAIDAMINHAADYKFNYIAYRALEKQYLHSINVPEVGSDGQPILVDADGEVSADSSVQRKVKTRRKVYDRPQYMFMRVAIEIALAGGGGKESVEISGGKVSGSGGKVSADIGGDSKESGSKVSAEISVLDTIRTYYTELSEMRFIYATPTNFNACTKFAQLNSCFLLNTEDSIEEIMRTVTNAALISKRAGGIGIAYHKIRCRGSAIKGTNGESSGIVQQLKIYNEDARCWNQGGGKRPGAFAIYLEVWHGDIIAFLRLKLTQGEDNMRARDLFYALWMCDLFMSRSRRDEMWSLFSEDTAPGLCDVFDGMRVCAKCGHCANINYMRLVERGVLLRSDIKSKVNASTDNTVLITIAMVQCKHSYRSRDVFTNLYTRYEREGRAVRRILPSIIIDAICEAQRDQGVPYICFKDHANRQTNQRNIGTLQSSNLCTEIFEWHDKDEYACCSLASINLKSYVLKAAAEDVLARFDFARMHKNVKLVVRGLDRIITSNQYPVPECRKNANKYRPIGIGVQGLANVFMELRIPFLSPEAERLDLEIFETLYHAALEATCELAEELGPYEGFEGSPASEGLLRMDLWLQNQLRLREYSTGVIETMAGYGFCANSASTDSASTDSASTDMSAPDPTYRGSRILSGRYNWDSLRDRASRGMRNSLLVAPMPTVTTSILLGNYESFEPMPMNIYTSSRSVGKVTECCEYMVKHLIELGLWNDAMKNRIIANDGKLSGIESIPAEVRNIYMTVWEMKQTAIMRRAALRHVFVDQGQSLNIHLPDNSSRYLRGVLNVGWELGNNTGSYYIRTPPASDPLKNNIAEVRAQEAPAQQWNVISSDGPVCTPGCDSCGS